MMKNIIYKIKKKIMSSSSSFGIWNLFEIMSSSSNSDIDDDDLIRVLFV